MVTVGQGIYALSVDHSEQLPDRISTCDVSRGLLYVVAVCFVCVFFSSDSNMISIGTVEFRYYVAII